MFRKDEWAGGSNREALEIFHLLDSRKEAHPGRA